MHIPFYLLLTNFAGLWCLTDSRAFLPIGVWWRPAVYRPRLSPKEFTDTLTEANMVMNFMIYHMYKNPKCGSYNTRHTEATL